MEKVLVVDRKIVDAAGFSSSEMLEINETLIEEIKANHAFILRSDAETDFTKKQIISYVVVVRDGEIFTMRRTKKQTEARLHNKISLGVGGHINPSDEISGDALEEGMKRELFEEVDVKGEKELIPLGLINDNSTEVGQVHFGLCYIMKLEKNGDCFIKETEKMTGEWFTYGQAMQEFDQMEGWSQIVLNKLGSMKF